MAKLFNNCPVIKQEANILAEASRHLRIISITVMQNVVRQLGLDVYSNHFMLYRHVIVRREMEEELVWC